MYESVVPLHMPSCAQAMQLVVSWSAHTAADDSIARKLAGANVCSSTAAPTACGITSELPVLSTAGLVAAASTGMHCFVDDQCHCRTQVAHATAVEVHEATVGAEAFGSPWPASAILVRVDALCFLGQPLRLHHSMHSVLSRWHCTLSSHGMPYS